MRRTVGIVALVALSSVVAAPAQAGAKADREITATVETPALFDDEAGGDADADDPAIWINRADRAKSRVIGTAKNGGLRVYDLAGREVQSIAPPADGRFNNVDLVTGFRLGGRTADLAVVTDRGLDQLRIYRIESTGRLTDVTAAGAPLLFSKDQDEVATQATGYGLAAYGRYAVVSRRHSTRLGIFRLEERGGRVTYRNTDLLDLPKQFRLPNGETWAPCAEPGEDPQIEGMVVDAAAGVLYVAQEDVALWRIRLDRDRFVGVPRVVERVAEYGVPATYDPATEECVAGDDDPGFGGRIHADVEGATIYPTGKKDGYLIVSSQGDSRFYVYDRGTNRPLSSFRVVDGPRADGVQHSDGAAATSEALPGYPQGLLVLHDGENTPDDGRVSTDFKYVDWRALRL
ncbi:3-phytase [Actinoplanes tereljensis]|uniref:Hydrolase n=1 Tax=Paractinoplanes tereljensis TaxID=571912 RepID=A0A919NX62_9ACTN|nr:phytase [Actinoplanes tereljensis]GIF26994.1 hydrolase [Actinoplanes tereljensis]